MRETNLKYWLIILVLQTLFGCNVTKVVPEGKLLLVDNRINRNAVGNVDLSDEKDNLKQKPNRELLGFVKFHLWAYQYGNKGLGLRKKQPWHRRWAEKVGEAPVLVDTFKMDQSARRLSEYYFSKGFLENEVSYSLKPKKVLGFIKMKKRAVVTYEANLESFHTLRSVEYNATGRILDELIQQYANQKLLKPGDRLDFENIEDERARLTALFRQNGYYYFNTSYIDFQIDTNHQKYTADVLVNVRNKNSYEPHYQQTLDSIIITIGKANQPQITYDNLNFIEGDYYVKPKALAKNIAIRSGDLYNADKVQKTYSNLLGMGLFNFVTIRFRPSSRDSLQALIAEIELKPASKYDFIWEPQTILTDQSSGVEVGNERNLGLANSLTLRNRNTFGGGESFNLNAFTALEAQLQNDDNRTFNSFRQTFNAELVFPSLLFLERQNLNENLTQKSTKLKGSYLYERNVNFTRNVFPFSFSYSFNKNRINYVLSPFRLSVNQALVEADFLASLSPETRFYTTQLLTNNIIAGPALSLYWSNRTTGFNKFWIIRSNALELSGNLLSAYFNAFTDQTGINKEVLGVKYSQYARTDFDASFNHIIDENNAWAARINLGFGLPYGNTQFLPFERRFFVGGGNSLRAWRPRTIGPGSFSDSSSLIAIEKTGEMLFQGSVEYRFDIIDQLIDGAIFMDGGNIWNFREDPNFPSADFQLNRFYKEIALNTGLGLRFDLTYVILRVDWGIAVHDPAKLAGDRWVIQDFFTNRWVFDNTAVNFAIGYPF